MTAFWSRFRPFQSRERRREAAERISLEDALKHLYDCERAGRPCTLESLAGVLESSRDSTARLLTSLEGLGFVRPEGEAFGLTDEGRRSAVRVLRSHRLWEHYLAHRTGAEPASWHPSADRMEHRLTEEETEELDLRLGRPLFDPHGDPIPTREGDLPPPAGTPLTRLDAGRSAEVIHVEDEPPEIFETLVAQGFAPGSGVQVLEADADVLRLRIAGREQVLNTVAAANVTVEPFPAGVSAGEPVRTLAAAELGEAVTVSRISPTCQGPNRRRLLDLGVVPGTTITPELSSSGGDPVAYRIRGALIAFRRDQAASIEIEPGSTGSPGEPEIVRR
jgi:DtxR family Mn-dependent transcriptional regulator